MSANQMERSEAKSGVADGQGRKRGSVKKIWTQLQQTSLKEKKSMHGPHCSMTILTTHGKYGGSHRGRSAGHVIERKLESLSDAEEP